MNDLLQTPLPEKERKVLESLKILVREKYDNIKKGTPTSQVEGLNEDPFEPAIDQNELETLRDLFGKYKYGTVEEQGEGNFKKDKNNRN